MKELPSHAKKSFWSRYLEQILYIIDICILNLSFLIAVYIRIGDFELLLDRDYQLLVIFSNILWLLIVGYKRTLKSFRVERVESMLLKISGILLLHCGVLSALVVFMNFDYLSRLTFLYFYLCFAFLIVFMRTAVFKFLKVYRAVGNNSREVIVIGSDDGATHMLDFLSRDLSFGFRVLGFFDEDPEEVKEKFNYLGKIDKIEDYLRHQVIDEMYISLNHSLHENIPHLIQLCDQHLIRIKFIPDFRRYTHARRVKIDIYDGVPVMMFRKEPLEAPINRIIKRVFDLFFSTFILLTICSWLFPILALLIKLSSKGPVFFKQERSGENNRTFTCFKFRTMKVNKISDEMQAVKNDPRITKIGAFMRKTNLDEFPQFLNVLIGNMTVIGPRPHMVAHTRQYSEQISNYLVRHYAKPGITGWAQVNGYRGETKILEDMEKRVKHDIFYIENWSFFLDLKIIGKTVLNMIRGEEKAY